MDGWTHERKDGTATNNILLELVHDRSRRWYRSKHIVSIFSWTPDSRVLLWAPVVQLLLWVLVTRPVPVMQQERDFLGLRVSLGYRMGLGDLALDRWCSRICSLIPTTLNGKSVSSFRSYILIKYNGLCTQTQPFVSNTTACLEKGYSIKSDLFTKMKKKETKKTLSPAARETMILLTLSLCKKLIPIHFAPLLVYLCFSLFVSLNMHALSKSAPFHAQSILKEYLCG